MRKTFLVLVVFSIFSQANGKPFQQEQGDTTRFSEACKSVLSGVDSIYLRGEIKKNSTKFFSSSFIKSMCPQIEQIPDQKRKEDIGIKILANYSYAETKCSRSLKSKQLDGFGKKYQLGGIYWLPLDTKWRKKNLNKTPCDYTANTKENQAQCVIYLVGAESTVSTKQFSPSKVVEKWPSHIRNSLVAGMKMALPDCYVTGDSSKKVLVKKEAKKKQ